MEEILKMFMEERPQGWEDTAQSWLMTVIVIAIVIAGLMFAYKGLRKSLAKVTEKAWSRGQTVLLIVIGLAPVLAVVIFAWYFTGDYFEYAKLKGLGSGIFVSWIVYLFVMLFGHLASSWRREIF